MTHEERERIIRDVCGEFGWATIGGGPHVLGGCMTKDGLVYALRKHLSPKPLEWKHDPPNEWHATGYWIDVNHEGRFLWGEAGSNLMHGQEWTLAEAKAAAEKHRDENDH